MKSKIIFLISLTLVTATLGFSFIHDHVINRSYRLLYFQEHGEEKNIFCYEDITLNRYRFSTEDILFTILNNMISGPQNIFLDPAFTPPLSIRKVHLFEDTLVIDFNRYLTELSATEEEILLTVFINATATAYPDITEMFWLSEGRKISHIKAGYSYAHPIQVKSFTPRNVHNRSYLTLDPQALSIC